MHGQKLLVDEVFPSSIEKNYVWHLRAILPTSETTVLISFCPFLNTQDRRTQYWLGESCQGLQVVLKRRFNDKNLPNKISKRIFVQKGERTIYSDDISTTCIYQLILYHFIKFIIFAQFNEKSTSFIYIRFYHINTIFRVKVSWKNTRLLVGHSIHDIYKNRYWILLLLVSSV